MREEFVVMEAVKEALCFVSPDVRADLAAASRRDSPHRREFVLPDGVNNLRGFVREPKEEPPGAEPDGAVTLTSQAVFGLGPSLLLPRAHARPG